MTWEKENKDMQDQSQSEHGQAQRPEPGQDQDQARAQRQDRAAPAQAPAPAPAGFGGGFHPIFWALGYWTLGLITAIAAGWFMSCERFIRAGLFLQLLALGLFLLSIVHCDQRGS